MKFFDRNTWFWFLLGGLLFFPFIGEVHLFDWDEINFAELAREMLVTGDYLQMQINYETFTEKPPLFFWLQAISMQLFGVNEFAARFPNALLGFFVMPFLYIAGKFLYDRKFGFLWTLSWFGSILPFLYFKSGIIDPVFNFFIFNGLFFLIQYMWRKKGNRDLYFSKKAGIYLLIAGVSVGFGILSKGPVAYLIVGLCLFVYWIIERFRFFISPMAFLKFTLAALAITFIWLGVDMAFNGPDFLIEFTIRQWELLTTGDAGHSGFLGYHFVVLLFGCFPASIFAIRGMGKFANSSPHIADFQRWMIILLWVILILFSLVGTKIIHYSSMAYYPISFLSALTLRNLIEGKLQYRKWISILIGFIGLVIMVVSFALPWIGLHLKDFLFLFEKDPFALANMSAEINWSYLDFIPSLIALLVLIGFFISLARNKYSAFKILFFGNIIWIFSALIFFIAKVEGISQRASVEFFESMEGKNVYVTSYDYKSYVPWFYSKIEEHQNENAKNQDWLLYGETDKSVLISCKINSKDKFEKDITDAKFLYEKNGFYFYQRR